MRLCDKSQYLSQYHYIKIYHHNGYGRTTYGAPNHKFAWILNQLVLWGHVTNLINSISTRRGPMNTKIGKVLTYLDRLPPLKPHETYSPLDHEINVRPRDNLKKIISPLSKKPLIFEHFCAKLKKIFGIKLFKLSCIRWYNSLWKVVLVGR